MARACALLTVWQLRHGILTLSSNLSVAWQCKQFLPRAGASVLKENGRSTMSTAPGLMSLVATRCRPLVSSKPNSTLSGQLVRRSCGFPSTTGVFPSAREDEEEEREVRKEDVLPPYFLEDLFPSNFRQHSRSSCKHSFLRCTKYLTFSSESS